MRWRERIFGWVVVGLVLCGLAVPVVGQEGEVDPDGARAMEILESLAASGQYESEVELVTAWVDALEKELGLEHPQVRSALFASGRAFYKQGQYHDALLVFARLVEASTAALGQEDQQTLTFMGWLAGMYGKLGRFFEAQEVEEEVLAVLKRILGEEHPATLKAKGNLAGTLRSLGDLSGALQREEEVLATLSRQLGEEHPVTLSAKHNLAGTLQAQGDLMGAKQVYQELIALRAKTLGPDHDPDTEEEANNFFRLAQVQSQLGQLDDAYNNFLRGLDTLEAQVVRADLSEDTKSSFKERYARAYQETLAAALARESPVNAFHVLERYRTQSLMNLFRWSRPGSGLPIPEELRIELAEIAQRYDGLTRQIDASFPDPNLALLEEQGQLRRRREVIQGQIIDMRREAEGTPEPPTLEEIHSALDPGTALLAYSIGQDEGYLFVLTRDHGLEVHPVETKAETLRLQAERLRAIDLGEESSAPEGRESLARWLYERLLGHAADRIESSERVLVLPDGPLYYLPFPALTRPTQDDPLGWQYLAEWKPFHIVQSATVYAELQAKRTDPGKPSDQPPWQWVGIGDPVYPIQLADLDREPTADLPDDSWEARLRSTKKRGIWDGLTDLPHTAREIQEISAKFPKGHARTLVDHQATEDEARKLLGNTRIAHFAAHGLADPGYPLDSFVALSLLESDELEHNGLLQAWEIIDQLELNADLVVLSACVTAFGPNRGGEGLISLSRAFQIAGARSVLASLWAVNDLSTSELMIRFYRHLLAGETKDRALQLAQIELIRGPVEIVNEKGETETPDFSAPYHWAAFQLIGDWK